MLDEPHAVIITVSDLLDRFPEGSLPPDAMRRAGKLGWRQGLSNERAEKLIETLAQLQVLARQVLSAALDNSVGKLGRQRLSQLLAAESSENGGR